MIIALDVTLGNILKIDKAGRDVWSCDFEDIHVLGFNSNFIYSISKNVEILAFIIQRIKILLLQQCL